MKRATFEQFDVVQITTTKNVTWMSNTPGSNTDPNGKWSVVCTYPKKGNLLIQKESATALIPAADVIKVANYDILQVFDKIEQSSKKYLRNKK